MLRYSSMRKGFAIGIVAVIAWLAAMPMLVLAQQANTSADVRTATAYATSKGLDCKVQKSTRSADCSKQTTTCDTGKWAAFISSNVDFINGSNPQQKSGGERLPDNVYAFLSKNTENRNVIPPLNEAACYCECANGSTESACQGKAEGTPFRVGSDLTTYEECLGLCTNAHSQIAAKCAGSLPTFSGASANSTEGQSALDAALHSADTMMMCFTQDQCVTQKGRWEAYDQCPGGKGRCVAPEPTVTLNTPIAGVTSITGFSNYVVVVFRYMLSIVVFLTTVMFIWGAFRYLVGTSMGGVSRGKAIMKDAVIGMILLLCSVAILRTINPATVRLNQVKVYLINTQMFIQSQFCKDLNPNSKLADAGESGAAKDRSVVDAKLSAYSEVPKTTECGHAYYIQDSTAGTCEGLACDQPNEICVSCVSGTPEKCQKQKSQKKVCDKQIFAGSIDYQDERYPEQIYLVGVCGFAQTDPYGANAMDIIGSNITIAAEVDLAKLRMQVGNTATDESVAGNAMYSFKLDSSDVQTAVNACPNGSFRGFLLGVQYNDGAIAADDMALLSKQNCAGGSVIFDGYADGGAIDKTDLGTAFLCGLRKTPMRFMDSSGIYWKRDEIEAAIAGRQALSCNFNLSNKNAPEDPGTKDPFCAASAAKQQTVNSTAACASAVKAGDECDTAKGGQACSLGTKICKCTPVGGTMGGSVTSQWKCE